MKNAAGSNRGFCACGKPSRVALCVFAALVAFPALAAELRVQPDTPNSVEFPPCNAKFVRFVILATAPSGEACLDELEVYGPDGERNLALASNGAKATASSCLAGHAIHQIDHLNDGQYGNANSWIAAGSGAEWAEIELSEVAPVGRVVFSRDRTGVFRDRTPSSFEILLSRDGEQWETVKKVVGEVSRVSGADAIANPPAPPDTVEAASDDSGLYYEFLGEEHAWLKTHGRADISPALVPYNGRVKEYPRHVGDDHLPLPPLSSAPKIDGRCGDACWQEASRGVVRVASPYDFRLGPLIEYELTAGRRGDDLFLYLKTDRLLSGHVAVLSSTDWTSCGVIACSDDGLVFNTYTDGKVVDSTPIDAAFDRALTCFEMRVPLALLPGVKGEGLRVGLGIGGKHASKLGRPVTFAFSSLALAQEGPCIDRTFRVRLRAAAGLTVQGNAPGLDTRLTLAPGESRVIAVPADAGLIGPQYDLTVRTGDEAYTMRLFRYDPVERTLSLMEELARRLAAKNVDVGAEQNDLERLRARQDELMSLAVPDRVAERKAFFKARLAKRRLFLRDPDLAPLERVLFVKRNPFKPSHNYSVCLDAPFRPGGGIYALAIPRRKDRLEPEDAVATELFNAGEGIARNPMANFDVSKVYFAYRPSRDGYYHIMSMNPDGTELEQLTDGPFHDYWPCPLPDGGLAFITTRCKGRYLCWRPQAAVMFRMDTAGGNMRPLSFANLTEWAPSVMRDGRIIWTRSEYLDKGADFGHTLWSILPDGTHPELVFGNDIIQPNGYANGRQVPNTHEVSCTLISHFGDLNGPIALLDIDKGRFNPDAITSITPEVPWPGAPPMEECFRDPIPVARDYFLCSHAPRDRFEIYVIDRFGNREVLYGDPEISSMCPTVFRAAAPPPVLAGTVDPQLAALAMEADDTRHAEGVGEFVLADVYAGIEPVVERGTVKYVRVVEEVRDNLEQLPNGEYRKDHEPFMNWYASPVDLVNGPYGWPTYVAKASWGTVPVQEDGSAHFYAPAGKVLYFQALDKDFNELQRMRSVVQLQPGEKRSCIGCHESRQNAPLNNCPLMARGPRPLDPPSWGSGPFSFEEVVQPVLDAKCVQCHDKDHKKGIDLTGERDENLIPASYRTLVSKGLVHYCDYGWNSGGCEKIDPLTFGVVKSRLWEVLNAGHHGVTLTVDEMIRLKTWIDLNCPLWPDYMDRTERPKPAQMALAR